MSQDWIDDPNTSFEEKMERLESLEPVEVTVDLTCTCMDGACSKHGCTGYPHWHGGATTWVA